MEKKKKTQKNKKSKKSSKQIIILASIITLILIVVFIILLIIYSKAKEDESVKENRKSFENAIEEAKQEEFETGKIVPNRFNMFERMYEGDVVTSKVYYDLYSFVTVTIPDMQNRFSDKTDSDIGKFFDQNKGRVENNTGLTNKLDYINLVNYVKNLDLGQFLDSTFDELNFQDMGEKDRIPIELVFTKGTLTIILEIDEEESSSNPIRFFAQ